MPEKSRGEMSEERLSAAAIEGERQEYGQYLKNLGISPDDLRGKRILDAGAGERFFAAHLLREEIADEIFSLEPLIAPASDLARSWKEKMDPEIQKQLNARTIKAFNEAIPLKNESIDLVLVNCFPVLKHYGRNTERELAEQVEKMFDEFVRVLSPGGELRYFPLRRLAEPWRDRQASAWRSRIMEKLSRLKKAGFEVVIEEARKFEDEKGSEEISDRVILRKPRK